MGDKPHHIAAKALRNAHSHLYEAMRVLEHVGQLPAAIKATYYVNHKKIDVNIKIHEQGKDFDETPTTTATTLPDHDNDTS